MKKYLLGLVLIASSCAFGQNSNQFSAPSGPCVPGPQTVTDISVAPAQPYTCAGPNGHTWIAMGSTTSLSLLAQIPTNGLIGLYTHEDCTNPYRDYSGNGNDGKVISGVAEPACSFNGLTYGASGVRNGWQLPTAVSSTGVSFIFSLLPAFANTNGSNFSTILQSDSTGGVLGFYGNITQQYDAWLPAMGTNSTFNKTVTNTYIPSASTIGFSVGTGVSGDVDHLFSNGIEMPYSRQAGTTAAAFNIGNLDVGGVQSQNTFYGIESVTLVYSRELTSAEHAQIAIALNAYTQARSGLVIPTPSSTNASSTIVCNGTSITAGLGVPNSWCTNTLLNVGETFNAVHPGAVGGQLLAAIATRSPQAMIPYYSLTSKNTGYVEGGTNDLAQYGMTVAATWTAAMRAISSSRWGNAKIVWMPMLSRTGSGVDALKDSFNTLGNAQCPTVADYCVAPDDPNLYADGANSGTLGTEEACPGATTYFQADCIHPTTAGDTLIALYASNAYKQLYGSTQTAPTQVSTSTYTVLASDNWITTTANSAITLYNCLGYSKAVHIKVLPGLTVTVANATSAQTIDGVDHSGSPLALTAGSNYTFQVVPGAPATGGCTWIIN